MISAPFARAPARTGTNRANGLSLLVSRKLSPACFTLARKSPKWRAASVEVIVVSMQVNVKYDILHFKVDPVGPVVAF